MTVVRVTIGIFGLGCGGALILERSLTHVPGVREVYVNPATEMAYVAYDPAFCDEAKLVHAIEKASFGAGQPQHR